MDATDIRDEEDLIAEIEYEVSAACSKKIVADRYGVSQQYLGDVLNRRRHVGPKLAAAFGFKPIRAFMPLERGYGR